MKRPLVVLLHLGFWGCYFILTMVILGIFYGFEEEVAVGAIEHTFLAIFFFAWVPSFFTFNSFYFLLFPKFVKQRRHWPAGIYGVLISLVAALIGYSGLYNLYGRECIVSSGFNTFLWVIAMMTFLGFIAGIIAFILQGFLTWIEEIKLKEQLKEQNQEMEMALVKAQLDPHFLFNTLNNLDVLILKNAHTASAYLNKLSDIFRFTLFETKTEVIPLQKEINYIKKYIALQKIRTANTNYVKFSVSGEIKEKAIAPMVLIPFIENAFKHTTNKKIKNAIQIDIDIKADYLEMICINKFDENRKDRTNCNGLGNGLIQKRLDLIYPEAHDLKITNQQGVYIVQLAIPLALPNWENQQEFAYTY